MHEKEGPKKFTVFINDVRYQLEQASITGAELKQLGTIAAGNRLFLEDPGPGADQPIADVEVVQLRSGMKFYDLPPGVVG